MNRTLLLVCTLLACNPDDRLSEDMAGNPPGADGKPPPVSMMRKELVGGSRLKAKFINGEDGSQITAGFFDSKLGVDCAFMEAEDGKLRCLPTQVAGLTVGLAGTGLPQGEVYLDSSCTQRAAVSSLCGPPMRYVRFTDTCGSRPRIAPITEVPTSPRLYYTKDPKGSCYGGDAAFSQLRFYAIGTPMQPTDFAAGMLTME